MRVVLALAWHQPSACRKLICSAKIQKKVNTLPIVTEILYNLIVCKMNSYILKFIFKVGGLAEIVVFCGVFCQIVCWSDIKSAENVADSYEVWLKIRNFAALFELSFDICVTNWKKL